MIEQKQLSLANIADARHRIEPLFLNSAVLTDTALGLTLFAKDETDNPIRCFKGRGAGYYLACAGVEKGPLVTASAGNFGQGLAYAAARVGREVKVFASVYANPMKVEAMRRLGAKVVLFGDDFDAAKVRAKQYAIERNAIFVEDGASASIAEGAGTIGAELAESVADIHSVFVPLGNGALAAGVGCWFKHVSPATRIIAVASEAAPCMMLSWRSGKAVSTETAATIADGIAVRTPVSEAIDWLRTSIDDVMLVDDATIVEAMKFAYATWGRLVEPAGAAGLAAILASANKMQGLKVATILCGGNLTAQQIDRWMPEANSNAGSKV